MFALHKVGKQAYSRWQVSYLINYELYFKAGRYRRKYQPC